MNSMNGMKRKRKLLNELKPKSEQLACIKEAQSMYKDIYEGFKNQERKTFLIEEDFQEERKNKSYVDNMTNSYIDFKETKDNWKLFPLWYEGVKVQDSKHYNSLYRICDRFPFLAICAINIVKPKTSIGKHQDLEPGWRAHITLDSGGEDTGMADEYNGKKIIHKFVDGEMNIMQPTDNPHQGWNNNDKPRVNLFFDFYNDRYATKNKFKKYIKQYNDVHYGFQNLHDFYDAKRIFGKRYNQTYAEFLEGDLKYAT